MSISFIIPMRSGSKGLRDKNLKLLNGKPLFRYSVDDALKLDLGTCYITTDYPESSIGELPNGTVYHRRPDELADDNAMMHSVVTELLDSRDIVGTVVLLQATSPLRSADLIQSAINKWNTSDYSLVLTAKEENRSVLKWGIFDEAVGQFIPINRPEYCFQNRQTLPSVLAPTGSVYVFDAEDMRRTGDFNSDSIGVIVEDIREAIDIDSAGDFANCEQILRGLGQ